MTISITKSSRIAALAVGAGLVLAVAFGSFAAPAYALTQAEATTIIQVLGLTGSQAAAIQALVTGGGGSTSSCTFTRSLTIGSSGADVTCLQQALISMGFSIPAGATGYFGAQTQAAVASWQTSKGVTPAVGYFGPISQAAWGSAGGSTGGSTGGSGSLSGGAGAINDADFVSGLNNEEVGEDAQDVEIAGLDIEADDGSDIEIVAVTLNFSQGSAGEDFEDYADEVTVWIDGKQVASVDADMFEDDNDFDRTISLDSGGIIEAGERGDLVVAVTGVGNLDSTDAGDTWTVEFESVRYRDAQGATITDSSTGDIGGVTRTFSFDTFATANDVELSANTDSDTPEGTIVVDATDDTDGVELLRFTFEAEGSDIRIRDLPITFATTSGNTAVDLDDMISSVYVEIDGDESSESVSAAVNGSAGATVVFEDVDVTISEGDEVTVVVKADFNDTEAAVFVDGDGLTVSFTASNRGALDAEDETGESLATGDKTGTGTGEALTFVASGVSAELTDSVAVQVLNLDSSSGDDQGQYTIEIEVTALEDTAYIELEAASSTSANSSNVGIAFGIENASTGSAVMTGTTTATLSRVSGGSVSGNFVRIDEGQTATFSLVVYHDAAATGIYRVQLDSVGFSATAATQADNEWSVTPVADFESDSVQVQN